ncbi:hypothetical protein PR202_ga04298 [Eleusine coracana subsp. coracana]|uniref:Uncharacterized protein n=1 Tax=Eleusine coracana subsp. coracana TaxID=191504 RepID=A0AAV5BPL2_ELECO|nr:hypothetical protein PR202_ga04298 [Eleusine coracana subsp. coracana]
MAMEPERDSEDQRRPLLHAPAAAEQRHQQQYQYLGRSSSSVLRGAGAGGGGPEVSADEVRSAASFSSSAGHYPPPAPATLGDQLYPFPPSIHSAVLSPSTSPSPAPASPHPHEGLAIVPQEPYPYGGSYQPSQSVGRDTLDEVEIRQLLIDHAGIDAAGEVGLLALGKLPQSRTATCGMCSGKGMLPCIACSSRGLVTCKTCTGYGSLLAQSIANVQWKTLSARKVSATRGAASVPEEVFHRARGVQLCNIQAYQCTPAFFADSYPLNQFSSEIIASRLPVPPSARVISERHIISVVPVTRVTMANRKQSFSFYVIGYDRDVFIRDYPSKFCWGLCCCFNWLGK